MTGLREATIESLDQIRSLIVAVQDASELSGNLYATSGIGSHVRHVVDHFRALEKGIESGIVNYNTRRRESALERQSDKALLEIESLRSWLRAFSVTEDPILVESEISCSHKENAQFQSYVDRELLYLINHTIHHAAYVALMARQYDVVVDAGVGFAPATASHLRDSEAKLNDPQPRSNTEPLQPCRSVAN